MNPMLMLGNPRRRSMRRRHARKTGFQVPAIRSMFSAPARRRPVRRHRRPGRIRLYKNPRAMGGIVGMVVGKILPLAGGYTGGFILKKFLPAGWNKWMKVAVVVASGIAVPVVLGRFIGRGPAVLIGTGVILEEAVAVISEFVTAKIPAVGPMNTADDGSEVDLMAEGEDGMDAEGDPSLAEGQDPSLAEGDDMEADDDME